jgi:hypothetical protein
LGFKPFETVKDQIGFCGIWCGSCLGGNGAITELARKFEELEPAKIEKWVPKDFDFKEFLKGLSSIQKMSLCPGCRKGGGDSACKIRICALNMQMADCGQCAKLASCENFAELEKSHPKIREDLVEMRKEDRSELMEKWISTLSKKWPHCLLLCSATKK